MTWENEDISTMVRELRAMKQTRTGFSSAVVYMERILMKGIYSKYRNDVYYEILSQRIISFAVEAEMRSLIIGGAISKLLQCLDIELYLNTVPLLMESTNTEVKAAVLSLCYRHVNWDWDTYFAIIRNDDKVQRRLLELLDFDCYNGMFILKLCGRMYDKVLRCDLTKGLEKGFALYIKYSLQHRGMSAKDLIMEIMDTSDFVKLLSTLVSEYQPTETSAERDAEFALMLFHVDLVDAGNDILAKSKFREMPDGDFLHLKVGGKYGTHLNPGQETILLNTLNLKAITDFDFSNTELLEKVSRSGNIIPYTLKPEVIFRGRLNRETVLKIGNMSARLLLEISFRPANFYWKCLSIRSLVHLSVNILQYHQLPCDIRTSIIATLDIAFSRGELIDLLIRYGHIEKTQTRRSLIAEELNGIFIDALVLHVGLNKLLGIGNVDYYHYKRVRDHSAYYLLRDKNFEEMSNVALWKLLALNVAKNNI